MAKNKNNETLQKLMYDVMGELHNTSAPLVFLVGMVLLQICNDSGFTKIKRETFDIDCNWIDKPPSMDDLLDLVTHSIRNYNDLYSVEIVHSYTIRKTACFAIIDKITKERLFKIDIGIFPVLEDKIYYHGNTSFRGVLPEVPPKGWTRFI
jgi:hypothetical protein